MNKGFKKCRKKANIVIHANQMDREFTVVTLENPEGFKGKAGDYWMIGVDGEHYVCDKEIFEKTYEWVEEQYTFGEMISSLKGTED